MLSTSACIRGKTGTLLLNLFEGDVTLAKRNKVLEAAQAFYRDSLKYVLQKMLVVKGFSKNAVWIDFRNYRKANCSNVMYFVNQCKKI